jgi:hypothetical protein
MSDQEKIETQKIPRIDRVQLTARDIVLQVTIGNKHEIAVKDIEEDAARRIRAVVDAVATIMARDTAIRWERRAEKMSIDMKELSAYTIDLQKKHIALLNDVERGLPSQGEDLKDHPLKGWQPVPVTEPTLTPQRRSTDEPDLSPTGGALPSLGHIRPDEDPTPAEKDEGLPWCPDCKSYHHPKAPGCVTRTRT